MDATFKALIAELHIKYEELLGMLPVRVDTVPDDAPEGGVYLFAESGVNLYVGRTRRSLRTRIRGHVRDAVGCPFAWRLAREVTGNIRASYRTEGSRRGLLSRPEFAAAYAAARRRIRGMEVRYVGEADPLKQALLEIDVAVGSKAKHNDFGTH